MAAGPKLPVAPKIITLSGEAIRSDSGVFSVGWSEGGHRYAQVVTECYSGLKVYQIWPEAGDTF